jgi:hypothetical protein
MLMGLIPATIRTLAAEVHAYVTLIDAPFS